MLLDLASTPSEVDTSGCATYEDERLFIAWKGFIFIRGSTAGIETVRHLAASLERDSLISLCKSLRGIFVLFVFEKATSIWRITVDNAGLFHAYHHDRGVGTSFLELLAATGATHLSPAAVAEFLAHDGVHWSRTLVGGIARISYVEIVQLEPGDTVTPARRTVIHKDLPREGSGDEAALFEHAAILAKALEGRRVSIDLTGGMDSRLVACLMWLRGVEFEAAVLGQPELPDVTIAAQAARMLRADFHVTIHDSSMIEDEFDELFRQCDGLGDVLAYHPSRQLSLERRRRGVDLVITGAGGELYKDFWWLQDWPFYGSRKTRLDRLYDLRVHPISLPASYLTGDVAAAYADLRRRTIEQFGALRAPTNTETYDRIYFFYRMTQFVGRFATSNINHWVDVTAPLLDYDNVLLALALPRARRVYNRFHRSILSAHCPELSGLRTTEGMSAAVGREPPIADALSYGVSRMRRLSKKMAERALQRRWMQPTGPSDPATPTRVKRSVAFREALDALKEAGFIDHGLALEAIRNSDVGRLLTLGMLVRHLARLRPSTAPRSAP